MTEQARQALYVRIGSDWQSVEVPLGCYSELPRVMTLFSFASLDLNCGWWVVFYTERVVRSAAFLLWDVYENHRLWAVSLRIIAFVRKLDMSGVLSSRGNADELIALLRVV